MARANYTPYRAKHIGKINFGDTAWTETQMDSTTEALDTTFASNNATPLAQLSEGSNFDTEEVTKTACWVKSYSESGGERSTSEENLLGADATGSQCQELSADTVSKRTVEMTLLYRNVTPTSLFNDDTKCCLISMDNSEATGSGETNFAYNNIIVTHTGSLSRNADGFMEQTIKFEIRGGLAGDAISVTQSSPSESWTRYRVGLDYAEENRTA